MLLPKDLLKDCEKVEDPNKYATEKAIHPDKSGGLDRSDLLSMREAASARGLQQTSLGIGLGHGFFTPDMQVQAELQRREQRSFNPFDLFR